MKNIRRVSPALITAVALIFSLSALALGKSKNVKFPNVRIKNFGQMDDRFFRGARPEDSDYATLAALGVTTIIDLTDNSRQYEEPAVKAAGLRYVNIPMEDKSYPSMDQVNQFLKVVDDPATGKFFVHCAGGRHRTGVVGSAGGRSMQFRRALSERCIASRMTNGTWIRRWPRWISMSSAQATVTESSETS